MRLRAIAFTIALCAAVLLALVVSLKGCSDSITTRLGGATDIWTILRSFNEENAFKLLKEQVAMGARVPNTSAHQRCAVWLETQLRKYTAQLHRQQFEVIWRDKKFKLTNVVGVFAGSSGETLLIGTHWDCHPSAENDEDKSKRGEPVPGANDGASGTAVLIELARVLSIYTPPITVIIALFDGEDFGEWVYGSRHFVSNPVPYMPDAAIIIDMIGDANLNVTRELNSIEHSRRLWEAVMESAKALQYEKHFEGDAVRILDDHVPFIEAGKPAILLIDFEYPYWHTTKDTPDKCSPKSLGVIGRTLLHFIFIGAKKFWGN
ncbi:MAG: M28 family peptidase [Armatimonadota bacterium]|nr:M28 family peptidase [Armatimonadota bacterium]MCX7777973.1 M28 family peptidase [Armatimonadota bacterium]MDW8026138.1 M28 family peptidase [Armatimonadota bacterium]